jgi:hypothetical protein
VSSTLTIRLGAGSTATVTPQQTETPGLLVHDIPLFDDRTRLIHHSGLLLGIFERQEQAMRAATSMAGLIDWSADPSAVRAGGRALIWRVIDAVEAEDGLFECSPHGSGMRVLGCRHNGCPAPWEADCGH